MGVAVSYLQFNQHLMLSSFSKQYITNVRDKRNYENKQEFIDFLSCFVYITLVSYIHGSDTKLFLNG